MSLIKKYAVMFAMFTLVSHMSPVQCAAAMRDVQEASAHVSVNIMDRFDATRALIGAVKAGDPEKVASLIALGADANVKSGDFDDEAPPLSAKYYAPALSFVNGEHQCAIAEMLINAKANVNGYSHYYWTPLHCVVSTEDSDAVLDMIRLLISHKADVNLQNGQSKTPLHYCAGVRSMQTLLEAKASIDANDNYKGSVLHRVRNRSDVLSCFLANGTHQYINDKDHLGNTPLHCYAKADSSDGTCIAVLLDAGAEIDARASLEHTPLHEANTEAAVRVLCERGADIEARDYCGRTPLHTACDRAQYRREDQLVVVNALLERRADVNAKDRYGNTAVQEVAKFFDKEKVEFYKEHGFDGKRYEAVIARLIAAGAEPFDMSSLTDEGRAFIEQGFKKRARKVMGAACEAGEEVWC